ncbi:hypothetical protein [Novosphingobium sp. fls2-241-R2A-195]|uniref:hypothetical protein n=1 Tax=Novosphingobium sp. fls2-241-R2A-195 TaxID=3040296 RepID=UPI00254A5DDA|nr:hypothetical protein [Novosphingobium sp. fls2-241-R2A-195]
MRAARRRLKAEGENRTTQSWQAGAFTGLAQSKSGLKPLDHYLRRPPRKMSNDEMLAVMQSLAGRQNSKYEVN